MRYNSAASVDAWPGCPPSLREALRHATRDVHERLHRHPQLKRLADGTIGLGDYRNLLARFYGFHLAVEDELGGAGPRSRTPLLAADLLSLGLGQDEIASIACCPHIPALRSPWSRIGCAYVVEGSTLGGQVLAKAVAPLLGGSEEGRRFLLGHGSRHGAMWREFTRELEVTPLPNRPEVIAAAAAVFAAFEAWFDGLATA